MAFETSNNNELYDFFIFVFVDMDPVKTHGLDFDFAIKS